MKTNPNAPVFPTTDEHWKTKSESQVPGLTKRELLAALAMQSLISNNAFGAELNRIFDLDGRIARQGSDDETPMHYLGRIACAQADALIAALNQPTP